MRKPAFLHMRKQSRRSVDQHLCLNLLHSYTPNGYIVPAKFGVHFLPVTKNVPKRTKLHLNEIGLT